MADSYCFVKFSNRKGFEKKFFYECSKGVGGQEVFFRELNE